MSTECATAQRYAQPSLGYNLRGLKQYKKGSEIEVGSECICSHESWVIDMTVVCFVTFFWVGLLRLQSNFKVTMGGQEGGHALSGRCEVVLLLK